MLIPDTPYSARKWSLFNLGRHHTIYIASQLQSHIGSFCVCGIGKCVLGQVS